VLGRASCIEVKMALAFSDAVEEIERLMAENEKLRAWEPMHTRKAYRNALTRISEMLPCERPCRAPSVCLTCNHTHGAECAGCIAREALAVDGRAEPEAK